MLWKCVCWALVSITQNQLNWNLSQGADVEIRKQTLPVIKWDNNIYLTIVYFQNTFALFSSRAEQVLLSQHETESRKSP